MVNKSFGKIYVVLWMLLLASLACNFSFKEANIDEAYMAKDAEGKQKSTQFAPSNTFFAILELKNAPDDTQLKAIWYAVDAEGLTPNSKLNTMLAEGGTGLAYFSLQANDGAWSEGKYKVELFINNEHSQTLEFEVVVP